MQFENRGIEGPDLSFYQGNPEKGQFVDFAKMKERGVWFAIFKVGQDFWLDPAFVYNWSHAKANGIPRGAYWFLDKDGEGKRQAEIFWNAIKDDQPEGPLVVDFEDGSGGWRLLYDFIFHLQQLSGYPPERIWIYTGYYYWLEHRPDPIREIASLTWFGQFPLWLAAYTDLANVDDVKVPYPWVTALLWQRGTTVVWGPDYGVYSLELDWNTLNGDIEVYKKHWRTDVIPDQSEEEPQEEPTEGGSMKYKVIWSYGVARRKAPHTGSDTYTGLSYINQQEVEVVEENIPDANSPTDPKKVWVKFADGYYGASRYPNSIGVDSVRMVKIDEPTPDPDPTPERVIVKAVLHFDDGSTEELFPS
jgi:hypothetical protein